MTGKLKEDNSVCICLWHINFLATEIPFCHNKKFPVHKRIYCHRKSFAVTGKYFARIFPLAGNILVTETIHLEKFLSLEKVIYKKNSCHRKNSYRKKKIFSAENIPVTGKVPVTEISVHRKTTVILVTGQIPKIPSKGRTSCARAKSCYK